MIQGNTEVTAQFFMRIGETCQTGPRLLQKCGTMQILLLHHMWKDTHNLLNYQYENIMMLMTS